MQLRIYHNPSRRLACTKRRCGCCLQSWPSNQCVYWPWPSVSTILARPLRLLPPSSLDPDALLFHSSNLILAMPEVQPHFRIPCFRHIPEHQGFTRRLKVSMTWNILIPPQLVTSSTCALYSKRFTGLRLQAIRVAVILSEARLGPFEG